MIGNAAMLIDAALVNEARQEVAKLSQLQDGVQRIPQRDMIGAAQVALQSDRLKVSSELVLAATLVTDLQAFDLTVADQNDDLVNAVAITVWWGDRLQWNEETADSMLSEEQYDDTGRDAITGY